jgi:hypothetical protein
VGPTLVVTSGLEDQEVGPKLVVGWGHDSSVKPAAPAAQGSASCALRDARAHRTPATDPRARPIGNPISHAARRLPMLGPTPADSAAGARWRGRHWCSPRSAFSGPKRHPSPPSIGSQIRLFRPPLTAGTSEVGRAAGSLPCHHCGRWPSPAGEGHRPQWWQGSKLSTEGLPGHAVGGCAPQGGTHPGTGPSRRRGSACPNV